MRKLILLSLLAGILLVGCAPAPIPNPGEIVCTQGGEIIFQQSFDSIETLPRGGYRITLDGQVADLLIPNDVFCKITEDVDGE